MVNFELHAAIKEEDIELIEKLLRPGLFKRKAKRLSILNTNNHDGHTPLVHAIELNKENIIPFLLSYGADPNFRSKSGDLPLTLASGKMNQHNVVQRLINHKAEVDSTDRKTALMCSAEKGLHLTVQVLIEAGAELDFKYIRQTAIMLACHDGHYRVVTELINAKAELNCTDLDGFTALTIAARSGYGTIVEKLLKAGANTTITNMIGRSALQLCCMRGLTRCVRLLLNEANVQRNINARDDDGASALHSACEFADEEIIKLLILSRADVHAEDNDKRTPIIWAAFFGQVKCIKVLLESKAHLEDADNCGFTPLLTAALYNHAASCAALLSAGANIEARDKEGRWALDLCVESEKHDPKMGKAGRWTGNIIARSEETWRRKSSRSYLGLPPAGNAAYVPAGGNAAYVPSDSTLSADMQESLPENTPSAFDVIKAKASVYSLDGCNFSPVIPTLRSHVEMAIKACTPKNFTVRMLDLISDLVFGTCSIDTDQKIEVTSYPRTDISDMLRRLSEIWV